MSIDQQERGGNQDLGSNIEVREHRSWLQRLGDSLKGIVVGLVLFLCAIFLLVWNEGRAVESARALEEGAASVISLASDRREAANEGRLVHVSGPTQSETALVDSDFGLSVRGLKLVRTVEMFQWKEERRSETVKKLGGGEETVTRYVYSREWSERAVESSRFHEAANHRNPPMPAFGSRAIYARDARVGAFGFGQQAVTQISGAEPVAASAETLVRARALLGPQARLDQTRIYVGDPDFVRIGDLRIGFDMVPHQDVSVIGRQTGGAITPYRARNGQEILLAANGILSADVMFQRSLDENQIITWLLRAVGALVLFISLRLMVAVLSVLADVIPVFGDLVSAGTGLLCLAATFAIAPLVIAIAWLAYRPLTSAIVLGVSALAALALARLMRKRAVAATPPPVSLNGLS